MSSTALAQRVSVGGQRNIVEDAHVDHEVRDPKGVECRERAIGRWRYSMPLALLHSCPTAGLICGTAHAHHDVGLYKDPRKRSWQVRVKVILCYIELHSRHSCCVSH